MPTDMRLCLSEYLLKIDVNTHKIFYVNKDPVCKSASPGIVINSLEHCAANRRGNAFNMVGLLTIA
jgi:hypothetical protein